MEKLKLGIQQTEVAAEALRVTRDKGLELDRRRQAGAYTRSHFRST